MPVVLRLEISQSEPGAKSQRVSPVQVWPRLLLRYSLRKATGTGLLLVLDSAEWLGSIT